MNDRKYKYSEDQIDAFLEFKEAIQNKFSDPNLLDNIEDNIYCRFLDSYDWNLETCFIKMLDMLEWAKNYRVFSLDISNDLVNIYEKQIVRDMGVDK